MADNRRSGGAGATKGSTPIFWIILGLVVLGGVAWLVLASRGGDATTAALPTPAEFENLSAQVEADSAVGIELGRADAPVTLVEFADYSCPHCAQFSSFTGRLLRQNYVEGGGPLRWVLYDYVLGVFPNSVPAAIAARCAGDRGLYWPMHDLILARQTQWATTRAPEDRFVEYAEQIGLDTDEFRACMAEGRHLEEVAASRKVGDERGVNSTPTLFLNGMRLDLAGRQPYEYISGLIQQALDSARVAPSPAGTPGEPGGETPRRPDA